MINKLTVNATGTDYHAGNITVVAKINEIIDSINKKEPMMEPMMDHAEDKLEMISDCCGAPIKTHISYEGTGCYYCEKCGDACDPRREPIKEKVGECDHVWCFDLTCKKCGVGYLEESTLGEDWEEISNIIRFAKSDYAVSQVQMFVSDNFISKKAVREAISESITDFKGLYKESLMINEVLNTLLSKLNLEEA